MTYEQERMMKRDHPMTLKPPTKTFPKLVMKEWPHIARMNGVLHVNGEPMPDDPFNHASNPLSDFTRVVEETGILDQQRSQKEKSRDE